MNKRTVSLFLCAMISLNLCGCSQGNMQIEGFKPEDPNSHSEAEFTGYVSNFDDPQSAVVKTGDTVLVGADSNEYRTPDRVNYTIKSISLYDDISSFTFSDNSIDAKRFIENGKLKNGYKFVLLDMEADCIEVSSNKEDIENAHNLSCFDFRMDKKYYNGEYEICDEIPFIEVEEKEGIKHFTDSKNFYVYTLPKGSSANIQIGFFAPAAAIESKEAYISIDTNRINGRDESNRYKFLVIE